MTIPPLWMIFAGLFGLASALGGFQTHRLHSTQKEFSTFVAETKAKGEAQIKQNLLEASLRYDISEKREAEHATLVSDLESKYRDARLHTSSGGSTAPALSQAASVLNCPSRQSDIAGGLERLEAGILGLLERGDRAILRTQTCRVWIEDQVRLKMSVL